MNIKVLDYGVGNLKSVCKAFEFLGCNVTLITSPKEVENASILIFPGQGSFLQSMHHLNSTRLTSVIVEHISQQKPFFGICLGYQLLFEQSQEAPGQKGLSVFNGAFERFNTPQLKVPQMGWNTVTFTPDSKMYASLSQNAYVYFVHSYYLTHSNCPHINGQCTYGNTYPVSVEDGLIWGTQFHPEKSGENGLHILRNFINACQEI